MRLGTRPTTRAGNWELAGALVLAASLAWAAARLWRDGYAPQPFYDLPDASFMDLHSTAYWAHRTGAYSIWKSIYAPFALDLLRLVTPASCYVHDPFMGRACDWVGRDALIATFLLNILLVWRSYRRLDPATAVPRAAIVGLGLPMVYALERGNLLIPCFTAFVLGVGPLLARPVGRWLALAIAVNLKPYLLAVILPAVVRREWRWLFGFGVAGLALYLATWLMLGEGAPWELIANTGAYAPGRPGALWANIYYATSYWPTARLLEAGGGFGVVATSSIAKAMGLALVGAMRLAQLGATACFLAALHRPAGVRASRFLALYAALILTTITNGSSGYAQIFLFFLIFLEPAKGRVAVLLLVCAWLLSLPVDLVVGPTFETRTWSFLGGRLVHARHGLAVGQFARPGILLVIQFCLIALNLRDYAAAGSWPPRALRLISSSDRVRRRRASAFGSP